MDVESKYHEKSRALVQHAVDVARSYAPVLEVSSSLISELDVYCSLASLATSAPGSYVRPTLRAGNKDIIVKQGRHAVMEVQDGLSYIANDYIMPHDAGRFQVITG
jgi:DNA mismatch repair protein MSH2